jgi:hypothetical protein
MIAPNLVPDAILGINFLKENNVVINLTEGSLKTRRDGSDGECKFLYGSLPKNKVEVGLIPKLKITKFAGSNLAEAVGFLRVKKSSARLPSEGK